jgi:hypothetical protein
MTDMSRSHTHTTGSARQTLGGETVETGCMRAGDPAPLALQQSLRERHFESYFSFFEASVKIVFDMLLTTLASLRAVS